MKKSRRNEKITSGREVISTGMGRGYSRYASGKCGGSGVQRASRTFPLIWMREWVAGSGLV